VTQSDAPIAALDVGSNTIRLVAARPRDGGLETVLDLGTFVRLGFGVDRTGVLDEGRVEHAVSTIVALARTARDAGVAEILAVATSAVRDARNGPAFVDRVRAAADVDLRIVSGEREAELTFIGATFGMTIAGPTLVVDLGGGSGEIIAANADQLLWGRPLPIGSGRMTERFVSGDPPGRLEIDALHAHVRALLAGLPALEARAAVFAGGTARRLPVLLGKEASSANLTVAEIDGALEVLLTMDAAEVVSRYAIEPERAQVLPAGCAVLAAIAEHYGVQTSRIATTGIRQGMLVERLRELGRL
jgi:exopolyphosphatase/guanosine-5'-triphosphate,3'-diphosphate pyrophosphatase